MTTPLTRFLYGLKDAFRSPFYNALWFITFSTITEVSTRSFVDTLFGKKMLVYLRMLWIFLKESVYEWARRDSGNCSNHINCTALERGDLRASFEPYSNLVSGVVASLSSKMYSLFFYNVVSFLECRLFIVLWIICFFVEKEGGRKDISLRHLLSKRFLVVEKKVIDYYESCLEDRPPPPPKKKEKLNHGSQNLNQGWLGLKISVRVGFGLGKTIFEFGSGENYFWIRAQVEFSSGLENVFNCLPKSWYYP